MTGTTSTGPATAHDTHLTGMSLWIARGITIAIALVSLGLFVFALPFRFAELIRNTLQVVTLAGTLSPISPLFSSDIWLRYYLVIVFMIETTLIVLFTINIIIIFLRRSDDWMALFMIVALITYGIYVAPALDALMAARPQFELIGNIFQALGLVCALFFFYLFPNGKFIPGWTRFLGLVCILWGFAWVIFPSSGFNHSLPFNLNFGSFTLLMAWWASGLYAQIYRYRRVSNPIERQQTKWILFGVALAVVVYGLYGPIQYWLVIMNPSSMAAVVFQLVGVPLFLLCDLIIPLAFTFSILRYHLWDIDMIIRRTLVYGGLTATLVLVYIASVVLMQGLVTAVGGQQTAIVTVMSTLLIAALFTPYAAASRPTSTGASTAGIMTPRRSLPRSAPGCATRWTSISCATACWWS